MPKQLDQFRLQYFSKLLQTLMLLALVACGSAMAVTDNAPVPAHDALERVNINTADAETLAAVLKGVGLRRAEAIVEYREANGAFENLYDLANVKGIGEHTVEQNETRIVLRD